MEIKFGDRLRDLRREKDMMQSEFGEIFGLSPSAIGSYERGEREPTIELIIAFAEFFGVSLDYMLGRAEERMSVSEYINSRNIQLCDVFRKYTVSIDEHTLSNEEKQNIFGMAYGYLFCKPDVTKE